MKITFPRLSELVPAPAAQPVPITLVDLPTGL